jgi:hypothetical protein
MNEYTGYHGTDLKRATNIIDYGFYDSQEDEWLGRGVYFFGSDGAIDGLEEARSWALNVKQFRFWAVIMARLQAHNPLDMVNNISHRTLFDKLREKCFHIHIKSGKYADAFCDYIIFNYIDEQYGFDLVMAYTEGAKKYPYASRIVRRPQIQICVKDQACIRDKKIVLKEEA